MSNKPKTPNPISLARIETAAEVIDPVFQNTPLIAGSALDQALACSYFAKVETLNPIRSFKGRGAEFFAATELRPGDHVVCGSAGNFGQGLARAAIRRGARCTVFAPVTANPQKIAAMRRLGAKIHLEGQDFDDAKIAAQRFAESTGGRYVEDGAEPAIAEGAGTIALELTRQSHALDDVVVPIGNGALLSGLGTVLRHKSPNTRILGVVAEQASSMKLSLDAGRPIATPSASTIADGIAVRVPIPAALPMLTDVCDAVLTVSERDIAFAVGLLHAALGLVIEPAGAISTAAILQNRPLFAGRRVATILTGGNIAPEVLDHCLAVSKKRAGEICA